MAYDFRPLRVLAVDDSELMREVLKTILENLGIGLVHTAMDGRSALKQLRDQTYDVIFCDWKMAPMDGLEFVATVRKGMTPQDRFVPIIMISGFTEEFRVREALDVGITEFLAKPLTAATVYSRLAWVIEHPRDFIQAGPYFGPDRRRRNEPLTGPDRRKTNPAAASA